MPNKLSALFTFFRSFWITMLIITLSCGYAVISFRTTEPIFWFFWFKIIADVFLFYLWYNLRGHELYYYYNLGLRKRILFASAIGIDLVLFMIIQIPVILWI